MDAVRICLAGLALSAVAAHAQSWTELDTLMFSPHRPVANVPLAEALGGSTRDAAMSPMPGTELLAQVESLTGSIAATRQAHGENSPQLVDDLLALARAYQQLGDHSEALVALERAQHIIRIDRGLYSLDQVTAVEAMIKSYAASRDYLDTLPLENYLQELVRRNPDDPRVVDVLTEAADRQLAAAQHYLEHGIPPVIDISIGSTLDRYRDDDPPTARQLARRTLRAARINYGMALYTAIESGEYDVADLLELEDRVVDTLYFEVMNPGLHGGRIIRSSSTALAENALGVLDAKLQNSRSFPGTAEAIAGTLIEIADWRLMFAAHGSALDGYREARRVLVAGGVPQETIAAMLAPEQPVVLPDFPARFARIDSGSIVSGWFDVEIELTRYGRVRDAEVVGRSSTATEEIEDRFRQHVRSRRFRPRFAGAELADEDAFSMRYHFSYERRPD